MNAMPLYFDKKTNCYLFKDDGSHKVICDECEKDIDEVFIFIQLYNKKETKFVKRCLDCHRENKTIPFVSTISQIYAIHIVDFVPLTAIPVIIEPPSVTYGNISTIDASYLPSEETIDNTKCADRSAPLVDMKAVKEQLDQRDAELEKEIDAMDVMNLLNGMEKAKPYVQPEDLITKKGQKALSEKDINRIDFPNKNDK